MPEYILDNKIAYYDVKVVRMPMAADSKTVLSIEYEKRYLSLLIFYTFSLISFINFACTTSLPASGSSA